MATDKHIHYRPSTQRFVSAAVQHPGNPHIIPEAPWEVHIGYNSQYRNPNTGCYQLWYQAFSGKKANERTHQCVVCYAESVDGVNWIKPNLGLYSYNGIAETNIVLLGNGGFSCRYGAGVIVDENSKEPEKKYKMAYFDWNMSGGKEFPGLCIAFSADGIKWNKYPHAPVLISSYGSRGDETPLRYERGKEWLVPLSISDAVDPFYDFEKECWAIYGKMWIDGPDGRMFWKHAMGRTESIDFIQWSKPELILTPDEYDDDYLEFHASPVFYYEGLYFSLIQVLNRKNNGGTLEIELAVSDDGLKWERPFRRQPFISKSGKLFDCGSILTNSTPIILDDEIRIYFGGVSGGVVSGDDYNMATGIGYAVIKKDRFAGIKPINNIGQITLKSIDFDGYSNIYINADASSGKVAGEILDEDGYRIPGFTREDAIPLQNVDNTRCLLSWKDRSLRELGRGNFKLRLYIENASIFAVYVLK